MRVLKVVAEGLITSFRYPHFMQGVQPTFEMPPPATIYGHICSVLGERFDPEGVQFAVKFSFQERFRDIEHTHILSSATGKLKGTTIPKVLEGAVNPFARELLYRPRLTLYLNRPDWVEAFLNPRYPVVLGRSQDLFTYKKIDVIELNKSDHAYLKHTLAPYNLALRTGRGIVVLMPRMLDHENKRFPTFSRYVVLHRRVHSREFLRYEGESPLSFWVDETATEVEGDHLGLLFHTWVGNEEDNVRLASLA